MKSRELKIGIITLLLFFVVLIIMFLPVFGNKNAFEASDDFFNSIAKGSSNYFSEVEKVYNAFKDVKVSVSVKAKKDLKDYYALILRKLNVDFKEKDLKFEFTIDLSKFLALITEDAKYGYLNKGEELKTKYNLEPKVLLYSLWNLLKGIEEDLKQQKRFKEAKAVSFVIEKALEVSYNFYGIEAEKATSRLGVLVFALVFYVIYTIWYGYGILWLFSGLGLEMKAGKKEEV